MYIALPNCFRNAELNLTSNLQLNSSVTHVSFLLWVWPHLFTHSQYRVRDLSKPSKLLRKATIIGSIPYVHASANSKTIYSVYKKNILQRFFCLEVTVNYLARS